jgi:hypothetical protein
MGYLKKIFSMAVLGLLLVSIIRPISASAASASLSLSPSSQNSVQGNTVSITLHEDSSTDAMNAVQANINYPTSSLKLVGFSILGGWSAANNDTSAAGTIKVAAFPTPNGTTLTGDHAFATVVFQTIATGTANVTYGCDYDASTCVYGNAITRASDNANILASKTPASVNVTQIDVLPSNQTLSAGQSLVSFNVRFRLAMQGDGNLVLYGNNMRPLWASNTSGTGANRVVMQGDGNLVVYTASNKAVWDSHTAGQGASRLVMQDDGNLVVYNSSNTPTWYTRTSVSQVFSYDSDHLTIGQTLLAGHYLRTAEGYHGMLMQPDGNLVLYGPGYHVLWASNTYGVGANRVVMQGDGNLVIYTAANRPVWASNTSGTGADRAVLQGDGNFVIYAGSTPKWWTGTNGRI